MLRCPFNFKEHKNLNITDMMLKIQKFKKADDKQNLTLLQKESNNILLSYRRNYIDKNNEENNKI